MADILIQIDDVYAECLTEVAKSNGISRRVYIAEYLMKSIDNVPGLVEMIRRRMDGKIELSGDMSIGVRNESALLKGPQSKVKLYRFKKRDSDEVLEAEGFTAGEALATVTGRQWSHDEYTKAFFDPEIV